MNARYAPILLICAASGCGSDKLNAEQCKTIFSAEIKFAMQNTLAPGGTVEDLMGAARYGNPHACEQGKTKYRKADYKCIVAAKGDPEIKTCLESAHRRMDAQ